MHSKPLVSVIIPTYKRSDCLCRTIDSVLAQTYPNIEIIVVDDNGIGNEYQLQTEARLKDYITSGKITYLKHEVNKNGSAARNTGFHASKGEYINFLDDDDEMFPYKIEKQVKLLEDEDLKYGAAYCNTLHISNKNGKIIEHTSTYNQEGNLCFEYLTNQCQFNTSAIIFRRTAILELKGFDESFKRHQDFELMTRFFDRFLIACVIGDPLIKYDETKLRTYIHSGAKDYFLKKQFLETLKPTLIRQGIYNKIKRHFWFVVMEFSIISGEYEYLYRGFKEFRRDNTLSLREYYILLKLFLKKMIIYQKK